MKSTTPDHHEFTQAKIKDKTHIFRHVSALLVKISKDFATIRALMIVAFHHAQLASITGNKCAGWIVKVPPKYCAHSGFPSD